MNAYGFELNNLDSPISGFSLGINLTCLSIFLLELIARDVEHW